MVCNAYQILLNEKKSLILWHISVALTFKETEESTLQLQAEGTVKKDAVKKSTVKESTVEENTVKDECFIKLKAALTPTV